MVRFVQFLFLGFRFSFFFVFPFIDLEAVEKDVSFWRLGYPPNLFVSSFGHDDDAYFQAPWTGHDHRLFACPPRYILAFIVVAQRAGSAWLALLVGVHRASLTLFGMRKGHVKIFVGFWGNHYRVPQRWKLVTVVLVVPL